MTALLTTTDLAMRFPGRHGLTDLLRGIPRPVVRALDGVSLDVRPGEGRTSRTTHHPMRSTRP